MPTRSSQPRSYWHQKLESGHKKGGRQAASLRGSWGLWLGGWTSEAQQTPPATKPEATGNTSPSKGDTTSLWLRNAPDQAAGSLVPPHLTHLQALPLPGQDSIPGQWRASQFCCGYPCVPATIAGASSNKPPLLDQAQRRVGGQSICITKRAP